MNLSCGLDEVVLEVAVALHADPTWPSSVRLDKSTSKCHFAALSIFTFFHF